MARTPRLSGRITSEDNDGSAPRKGRKERIFSPDRYLETSCGSEVFPREEIVIFSIVVAENFTVSQRYPYL